MSKGRHRRRPNGHPARVAARREREAARTAGAANLSAVARRVVREVESLASPFDVELWASHMLGTMWERRMDLPLGEMDDYALIYGRPLIEAISRGGGGGARIALAALAAVDDGELGLAARDLAGALPPSPSEPRWLSCVGEATVTSAAVMREHVFDDGCTVFLEARHPTGETHAVGVYIDHNIGVMAKDILLADSIASVAEVLRANPATDGELTLEPCDIADAAADIQAALELTEMTLAPPVSEEYAALRALAILRAGGVPGVTVRQERREMSPSEREALYDEFLASPEGCEFAADGDGSWAASLVIDFGADYVDGRPLRWSPVVVELFMADWIPRKVLADEGLFATLPTVLDAWVRFAGRKRGIPGWAIEATREAIPLWNDEMTGAGNGPASHGPGKQFLMAAHEAGVDLSDQEALTTFMAGWNARSIAS